MASSPEGEDEDKTLEENMVLGEEEDCRGVKEILPPPPPPAQTELNLNEASRTEVESVEVSSDVVEEAGGSSALQTPPHIQASLLNPEYLYASNLRKDNEVPTVRRTSIFPDPQPRNYFLNPITSKSHAKNVMRRMKKKMKQNGEPSRGEPSGTSNLEEMDDASSKRKASPMTQDDFEFKILVGFIARRL